MKFPEYIKFSRESKGSSPDRAVLLNSDFEKADQFEETSSRSHFWRILHSLAVLGYLFAGAWLLVWSSRLRSSYHCDCNAPARSGVEYVKVTMTNDLTGKDPFRGYPRPEQDDAWNDLLKFYNLRVSGEDLEKINRTSVPLNDEKGGYLATLDVYHELHCVNMIRKYIYRDYYPDKHRPAAQLDHVDHCIDLLRQVLMCHADISLHTYGWRDDDYRWPWPNFITEHECRSWDVLMEWAEEHNVPDLIGPIVQHPTLGISWREGDED